MKNKNFAILWIRDSLFAAAASLTSASVLSGFLIFAGIPDDRISLYFAAIPAVNLVISLLFSEITGKIKKTIPVYSLLCLTSGILTAGYALLFRTAKAENFLFLFLMILGCLLSAVTAVRNIFDYKLPCEVMELDDYSVYVSISGIISSAFGICAGALLSLGYKRFDFTLVTCAAYITAGICFMTASFINRTLKPVRKNDTVKRAEKGSIKELFKNRAFLILFFPNLIRGIGMAAIPMITLIGVNARVITEADGASVTVCTYIATFLSCVLYAYIARKTGVARLCIIGMIIFCAVIPAMSLGKIPFYILYTVSYIGYNIVSCALPDMVYKTVDPALMSVFHTWRLALSTIGTAISTAVIGKLTGHISPFIILLAAALSHIVCVLAYYAAFGKQINIKFRQKVK